MQRTFLRQSVNYLKSSARQQSKFRFYSSTTNFTSSVSSKNNWIYLASLTTITASALTYFKLTSISLDSETSRDEILEKASKPVEEVKIESQTPPSASQPEQAVGQEEQGQEQEGAYNPETGEINWDCPCLGGMADGPCGEEFKEAFSCFVYSKEEPKGIDCIEKFKHMQDCFKKYPEVYSEELRDDEDYGGEIPNSDSEKTIQQVSEEAEKVTEFVAEEVEKVVEEVSEFIKEEVVTEKKEDVAEKKN